MAAWASTFGTAVPFTINVKVDEDSTGADTAKDDANE
jgi:hypothetical protein